MVEKPTYDIFARRAQIGAIGMRPTVIQNIFQTQESPAPRLDIPLRKRQQELFSRHRLFAGRNDEIERLEKLRSGSRKSFHFVTGASGFGKTALLANWIKFLQQRGDSVCYQFINRFEGQASEFFALRNLCEQIFKYHGITIELTSEVELLKTYFFEILAEMEPRINDILTIVIDGFDEATDWKPGPNFFPKNLPDRVHVFFSARTDSEEGRTQWLAELDLDADQVDMLVLDRFDVSAIKSLLKKAGGSAAELSDNDQFVQSVDTISNGDPFYLRFLVDDIRAGNITELNIKDQPDELNTYLDEWRKQLFNDVDLNREEVYALLGILASARGKLRPADLKQITPLLQKGALLKHELSGTLRRYLAGDSDSGYALCHPRFRDFLCEHVFNEDEIDSYRNQLISFCSQWQTHHSDYAFNHFLGHLRDSNQYKKMYALITKPWKNARYQQALSPRGFVADIELVITTAADESPLNINQIIRCSLIYASLVEFASRIPARALSALTHLGHLESARGYVPLMSLPRSQSRAYLAIADVLLKEKKRHKVTEILNLALKAAEKIKEVNSKAREYNTIIEAFHKIDQKQLVSKLLDQLREIGLAITDTSALNEIEACFRRHGDIKIADDFLRRNKAAEKESFLDFSGIYDFSLEGDFSKSTTEVSKTLQEYLTTAQSQVDSDLIAEAISTLKNAVQLIESDADDRSGKLCIIAELFHSAGDNESAKDAASEAWEAAKQEEIKSGFLKFESRTQRLVKVAETFFKLGDYEHLKRAASDTIIEFEKHRGYFDLDVLAKIPEFLWKAEYIEDARDLTLKIVQLTNMYLPQELRKVIGNLSEAIPKTKIESNSLQLVIELILATEFLELNAVEIADMCPLLSFAAKSDDKAPVQELINGLLRQLANLPMTTQTAKAVGKLAYVHLVADIQTQLVEETQIASRHNDSDRAFAMSLFAEALAKIGRFNDANVLFIQALEITRQIAQPQEDPMIGKFNWIKPAVRLAKVKALCGDKDWAQEQSRKALASLKDELPVEKKILGDIGLTLIDSGAGDEASRLAQRILIHSMSYDTKFIRDDLPLVTQALFILGETQWAQHLSRSALTILKMMKVENWEFEDVFSSITRTVAQIADSEGFEQLKELSLKITQPRFCASACSSLSLAAIRFNNTADAEKLADDSLHHAGKIKKPYHLRRIVSSLGATAAQLGDLARLDEIMKCISSLPNHQQMEPFMALLPFIGAMNWAEGIDRAIQAVENSSLFDKVCLYSVASISLIPIDKNRASRRANEALDLFFEIGDGALTPDMLEHLVPALTAIDDRNGLDRLLHMPWSKRPYESEYVPMLKWLIPALYKVGVDEMGSGCDHVDALQRHEPAFSEAQGEIAKIEVQNGKVKEAFARVNRIKEVQWRANTLVEIVKILCNRGDVDTVRTMALEAVAESVVVPNKNSLLSELIISLEALKECGEVIARIKPEFFDTVNIDLVKIDVDLFAMALNLYAKLGDIKQISQVLDVTNTVRDVNVKARISVEFARAYSQIDELDKALDLAESAQKTADLMGDAPGRAGVLCMLAKFFDSTGQQTIAQNILLKAMYTARVCGRSSLFKVLRDCADLIMKDRSETAAYLIIQSILKVNRWWARSGDSDGTIQRPIEGT